MCPPTDQSQPQLLTGSPLPAPAPHTEVTESLTERREPETHASTLVRARRIAPPRPPANPGTHGMALRPSSVPQRVLLPEPPMSSLPHVPDPESDLARAASTTFTRLLATVVIDPDFESTVAFALVTELVDFAARSRLDYVAGPVTESESVCPPSVGLSLPLATAMDAEMASWKSTGTLAWGATQRSSQGYTFSLGSGPVSWRSTHSSSVLSSSCEAEIYAGAMAAQELRWLTYLLTDLGERPRSPPVLYVESKAMLALCHEQRLEHRTKHIALRYFLYSRAAAAWSGSPFLRGLSGQHC
ncbi:unnamed protein product [Closterium sp. NIES-54]